MKLTDKNYRTLAAHERARLLLAADARADDVERQRLITTCPRLAMEMGDPAVRDLIDGVQRVVTAIALELSPPLQQLSVISALTEPLGQHGSVVERVMEEFSETYLEAFTRGHYGCLSLTSDQEIREDLSETAWNAAKRVASTASDRSVSALTAALDALAESAAQRAAAALLAFETWATASGLDPAALLAGFPMVADQIARHAERIDAAEVDHEAVTQLNAILEAHVPAQQFRSKAVCGELR